MGIDVNHLIPIVCDGEEIYTKEIRRDTTYYDLQTEESAGLGEPNWYFCPKCEGKSIEVSHITWRGVGWMCKGSSQYTS